MNYVRGGGVTQSGISADLDQFEEPTADPEAPEPGSPQPGQTRTDARWTNTRWHRWWRTGIRIKYVYETE